MSAISGPCKSYRKGISLLSVVKKFDNEEEAERWFISQRWPNGIACPHCGDTNIASVASRKPQPYRCRGCRKHFSVKTGTLAQFQNPLEQMGHRLLPLHTNHQGWVEHEATPRPRHSPEIGLVHGASHTRHVERSGREVRRGRSKLMRPTSAGKNVTSTSRRN